MESLSISRRPAEAAASQLPSSSLQQQPARELAGAGTGTDAPRAARGQMGNQRSQTPSARAEIGERAQVTSHPDQVASLPATSAKAGPTRGPPSKLHEWLAREIEGKFVGGEQSGSKALERPKSATGVRAAAAAAKPSSALDELIEGRRGGWREQKTVIVDIRNGRRNDRPDENGQPRGEEHRATRVQSSSGEFEGAQSRLAVEEATAVEAVGELAAESNLGDKSSAEKTTDSSSRGDNNNSKQQQYRRNRQTRVGSEGEFAVSSEEEEQLRRQAADWTPNEGAKGKTPPTFGEIPTKLTRLPYFSYYGKARNVDLVSSADRRRSLAGANGGHSNASDGQHSELSATSSSSASSITKIPTLLRNYNQQQQQQRRRASQAGDNESARDDQDAYEDQDERLSTASSIERRIDEEQRRLLSRNGYSNISNLFPGGQPMSRRQTAKEQKQQQQQEQQRGRLNFRLGSSLAADRLRRTRAQSSGGGGSLLNLNHSSGRVGVGASQQQRSAESTALVGGASANLRRRNSLVSQQQHNSNGFGGNSTFDRIRSQNTLANNSSSRANISSRPTTTTMRRQNGATGSNKPQASSQQREQQQQQPQPHAQAQHQQRSPSYRSLRPASAAGGFVGRNYRSPSANSLYYGGSAGLSPYGAPIDPDCPLHGYPPGAPAAMSKSSQHLAAMGGSPEVADLLYDPYPYSAAAANYYERPPYAGQRAPLFGAPVYGRPAPADLYSAPAGQGGSSFGRYSNGGQQRAYYNASSRFSLRQAPSADGAVRSALAPTNEQLRRILGHQPHTKPIHLHPQWAFSRPFIHLQGPATRSPSPLDNIDQQGAPLQFDIRPQFEPFNQLQDTQAIRAVDFHPSGEVYAIGSNSRALRICAYPADHELRHFGPEHALTAPRILFKFLQVHRGSIYCVNFNATGQLLATGSNDQTVHIVRYNSVTHSPDGDEYRLTMHDGTVRGLCFIDDTTSGSSLLLSAGGGDNKIYVTDCDTITPFQSMAGHTQMVMGLHHWAGASFVSASYDRTIRFWDLRTRACTSIISAPPAAASGGSHGGGGGGGGASASAKWAGPGAPVCSVKIDPTGRLLASGHSDSTCMLYDIRGARIIQAFKPHDDEIRTVSFSPKSYYLLTGGYDGRIVLTDLQGDLTQELPSVCVAESDDKIVQSAWHPSDFTFVTTSANKTATLWAIPTE